MNKKCLEFVVSAERQNLLNNQQRKLRQLFPSVTVELRNVYDEQLWVAVTGSNGDENERAKNYIDSVCQPNSVVKQIHLTQDTYEMFKEEKHHNELERNSSAVVMFCENNRVEIRGSDLAVTVATSLIEQKENIHAAPEGSMDPALKEFALKLGYKEKQVESVAKKFGSTVDQNKLLQELIHTFSSERHTSKTPAEEPTAECINRAVCQDVVARGAPSSVNTERLPYNTFDGQFTEYASRGIPAVSRDVISRGTPSPVLRVDRTFDTAADMGGYQDDSRDNLRAVVIDGSNVAMSHGNQRVFSCRGIALCVQWFRERGHREVTVFVPRWRTEAPRIDNPITDQEILLQLVDENVVKLTPSRRVAGRNIVCYDDRFILDLAAKLNGVVVSNDNFRDLIQENEAWKEVIEHRLLMYSVVGDLFMVPDDPLGKHGPTLAEFLRKGTANQPRICPFIGRCTFGSRCRFYHPERDPNRRQKLMRSKPRSSSDGQLSAHSDVSTSCSQPPSNFQTSIARGRSDGDLISRGPSTTTRDQYQDLSHGTRANTVRPMVTRGPYGRQMTSNNGNDPYAIYRGHTMNDGGNQDGYHSNNGWTSHPGDTASPSYAVFGPVTTPQQYMYTPVHFGYTNSGSLPSNDDEHCAGNQQYESLFTSLKELFSDGDKDSKIHRVLKENPALCKNQDVNALALKVMDV